MIPEMSVGIDFHQAELQICTINADGSKKRNQRVSNDLEEVIRAIGREASSVVVAAEACNGSAALLDALHQRTGWQVKLCHPGYAQRMRNNPDKTDKSDSELIADLTRVGYLPEVWLAPMHLRDLRALVRYRANQMKEARAVKVRIRSLLSNNRVSIPEGLSLWTRAGHGWLLTGGGLEGHCGWIMTRYVTELETLKAEVKAATLRLTEFVKNDSFANNF